MGIGQKEGAGSIYVRSEQARANTQAWERLRAKLSSNPGVGVTKCISGIATSVANPSHVDEDGRHTIKHEIFPL